MVKAVYFRAEHKTYDTEIQPYHHYRYLCKSAVDREAVEVADVDRNTEGQKYPSQRAEQSARELVDISIVLPGLVREVRDIAVNKHKQKNKIDKQ